MDIAQDGGGVFLEMNATSFVGVAVMLAAFCCRATEVDVSVKSSPQTIVVNNDGEEAQPTIYVVGQTDASTQPLKHTVAPTLNDVRLCERMLSQASLILRPDGAHYPHVIAADIIGTIRRLWPLYLQCLMYRS